MGNVDIKTIFENHKIISSESKSWYIGKPGTTKHSFCVTWSPGALVLYGEKGSLTLIYSGFRSYESAKKWFADCTIDEFKGTISHNHPDNIEYFFEAFRIWGKEPHYK